MTDSVLIGRTGTYIFSCQYATALVPVVATPFAATCPPPFESFGKKTQRSEQLQLCVNHSSCQSKIIQIVKPSANLALSSSSAFASSELQNRQYRLWSPSTSRLPAPSALYHSCKTSHSLPRINKSLDYDMYYLAPQLGKRSMGISKWNN